MLRSLWAQPDAGTLIQAEPAPFRLFSWHTQPFPPPDTHHPAMADLPAPTCEQRMNTPVSITAILAGQANHVAREDGFVRPGLRCIANRRSGDAQRPTDSSFRVTAL